MATIGVPSAGLLQKFCVEEESQFIRAETTSDARFLLATTFNLTIPTSYDHTAQLALFIKENHQKFFFIHDAITDANFANRTRLKPGKTYTVKIFLIAKRVTVTSEECLEFLKTQKAVLVGAQGVSLAWQFKKEKFPIGKVLLSFSKNSRRGTPSIMPNWVCGWMFGFVHYKSFYVRDDSCLLCFCNPEIN